MKDLFSLLCVLLMAVCVSFMAVIFSPPAWEVGSIKNDFGYPVKSVAMVKDTVGVSLTHIEHLDEKNSYFICEIIEPTGSIGQAEVKLRSDNGKQFITYWDFVKYDSRTKVDRYEISGVNYQTLKELLRKNDTITMSLKDSTGSNLIKTIRCSGFEKMVVKARDK